MAGEYEPNDSRNVTGANQQGTPDAAGQQNQQQGSERWNGDAQNQGQQNQGQQNASQNDLGQQQQFDSSGTDETGSTSQWAGQVREHMEVIGADGTHVGTVDHMDGNRIKLAKRDSGAGFEGGSHEGHHHYISAGLIAGVEGDKVRLSASGANAYGMEEEK